MSGIPPKTLRSNELPEYPIRGPFGGIIADQPPDEVEKYAGFTDASNILFRKGTLKVRPTYTALAALPAPTTESINGVADFYTSVGNRVQTVITPTRLLQWTGSGWTNITGTLTGGVGDIFSWDVVAGKLCFCQGVDKVQLWDGVGASFAAASANAVPARYLMELANHLVVGWTVEAGNQAPQRIRWTGAGDPTDWTSFNAGQADFFNNLGPINGLVKLFQSGYAFQQWGITQIIPSGIGVQPFYFVPLAANSKGLIAPFSLAAFGENIAAYVGKDNIYTFNGSQSTAIGDAPMAQGRVRLGARKRIFGDLQQSDLTKVYGLITTSINGNDYNAYWLFIPAINVTWVYNFDEGNWTRFTFAKKVVCAGRFSRQGVIRIMDLVGSIQSQNWTPATLVTTNPLDGILIGFNDGTAGYVDFTGFSEQDWSFTLPLTAEDKRHSKSVKRVRFELIDLGPANFNVSLQNERGETSSDVVSFVGTGSTKPSIKMAEVNLSGFINYVTVSGAAGTPFEMVEMTPILDVGGENRGG